MRALTITTLTIAVVLTSCTNKNSFDASGTFEAEEIIIASEASGMIKQFNITDGDELKANQPIGFVDSTQLYLKKKQLEAQIHAALSKRPDISAQTASIQEQLKATEKEQQRINKLVKAEAATQKQLDDINAQIEVLKKQLEALQSILSTSSEGIVQETMPLKIQIEQVNDQLVKCRIINPINGTVLAKYAEANEITAPGKPLYKIADLSNLILRAYVSGNQLSQIKLGQKIKIYTDNSNDGYKEQEGTITWISDKAEFTPKTIQTKDERVNLVYAMKVLVKNDGFLKIGMYAEIKF